MSVSSLHSGFSEIVVVGGGIAGATIALVILLEEQEWTPAHLKRYGERRRKGFRRMRIAATLRAALAAQFGPEAAVRRAHFRDRVREDSDFGIVTVVTHLGPDRVPAWVFDETIRVILLDFRSGGCT